MNSEKKKSLTCGLTLPGMTCSCNREDLGKEVAEPSEWQEDETESLDRLTSYLKTDLIVPLFDDACTVLDGYGREPERTDGEELRGLDGKFLGIDGMRQHSLASLAFKDWLVCETSSGEMVTTRLAIVKNLGGRPVFSLVGLDLWQVHRGYLVLAEFTVEQMTDEIFGSAFRAIIENSISR